MNFFNNRVNIFFAHFFLLPFFVIADWEFHVSPQSSEVVQISNSTSFKKVSGAAWLYQQTGEQFLVTNFHVVATLSKISSLPDDIKVVYLSLEYDIVVLSISRKIQGAKFLPVASVTNLQIDQEVKTFGFLNEKISEIKGVLINIPLRSKYFFGIRTSNFSNFNGFSGAPVFNSNRQVIGFIHGKITELNVVASSIEVLKFLNKNEGCKWKDCVKRELNSLDRTNQFIQYQLGIYYEALGNHYKLHNEQNKEFIKQALEQEYFLSNNPKDNFLERKGESTGVAKWYDRWYEEAVKWHEAAAKQGNVIAQNHLGLYLGRNGNIESAKKWLELAADQGFILSQYNLAVYLQQQGYYTEAAKWYRAAAEQGDMIAQYNLGAYLDTQGNHTEAAKWYRLAAEQGYVFAQFNLGMYLSQQSMHEEAQKWFRVAAEQGDMSSQYNLGAYLDIQGNHTEAAKWYRLAAEQGDMIAQYNLATYLSQKGQHEEAKRWLEEAKKQGLICSSAFNTRH